MLNEKTVFWLRIRKRDIKTKFGYFCRYCGQYKTPFIDWCEDEYHCPVCTRKYDYMDAAEFEARVALKIMGVTRGDLPCGTDTGCPSNIMSMHSRINGKGCDMCILRHARLEVEKEMIREGKGPGSPEDGDD